MIIKDPDKRATLEEITSCAWMQQIDIDKNHKPLVSFQGISDDEHKSIVKKMVEGGVAEKDIIIK